MVILQILLDAEWADQCCFGSMPAAELLLRFQQRWECDRLPVSAAVFLAFIVLCICK